jgi:hypothetical protein
MKILLWPWRWWWFGGLAFGFLMIPLTLFWLMCFPRTQVLAQRVPLSPGYAFRTGESGHATPVEQAFFASSHGGWHGDGEDVTAYKVSHDALASLIATLRAELPGYEWADELPDHSVIAHLLAVLPPTLRPRSGIPWLCGRPVGEAPLRYYYVDREHAVLMVVTIQT